MDRLQTQAILQESAAACGLPPERFQSHSLRIGGATALYQATGEIELVKRRGRWSSDAVQRYLHDELGAAVSQQIAATMIGNGRGIETLKGGGGTKPQVGILAPDGAANCDNSPGACLVDFAA